MMLDPYVMMLMAQQMRQRRDRAPGYGTTPTPTQPQDVDENGNPIDRAPGFGEAPTPVQHTQVYDDAPQPPAYGTMQPPQPRQAYAAPTPQPQPAPPPGPTGYVGNAPSMPPQRPEIPPTGVGAALTMIRPEMAQPQPPEVVPQGPAAPGTPARPQISPREFITGSGDPSTIGVGTPLTPSQQIPRSAPPFPELYSGGQPTEQAPSGMPMNDQTLMAQGRSPFTGFQAAATEMPPDLVPGPPKTPEELERRKAGWSSFLERVKNDPHLLDMMFMMGAQLMQPVQPGQTAAGHISGAMMQGAQYAGAKREMARKAGLEERGMQQTEARGQREEKVTESGLETERQQRGIAQSAEGRAQRQELRTEKTVDKQLKLMDEQLKRAGTESEMLEVQLSLEKYKDANKGRLGDAELAMLDAQEEMTRAHAEYYRKASKTVGKGSAESLKLAAQAEGAKAGLRKIDELVKQHGANKGLKTYVEAFNDLMAEQPGLAVQWARMQVQAAGGGAGDTSAEPGPAGEGEGLTEDEINKRIEKIRADREKRAAPAGSSVGASPGHFLRRPSQ